MYIRRQIRTRESRTQLHIQLHKWPCAGTTIQQGSLQNSTPEKVPVHQASHHGLNQRAHTISQVHTYTPYVDTPLAPHPTPAWYSADRALPDLGYNLDASCLVEDSITTCPSIKYVVGVVGYMTPKGI